MKLKFCFAYFTFRHSLLIHFIHWIGSQWFKQNVHNHVYPSCTIKLDITTVEFHHIAENCNANSITGKHPHVIFILHPGL